MVRTGNVTALEEKVELIQGRSAADKSSLQANAGVSVYVCVHSFG